MSEIADGFSLFEVCKDAAKCQIHRDVSEDNIILTHGDRRAIVLNVADQKVIGDWSLKSGGHLKSAVVAYGDRYAGIILSPGANTEAIRSWDAKALTLDKMQKHNVEADVHTLLGAINDDAFVVYKDSRLSLLRSGTDSPVGVELTGEIKWCDSLQFEDKHFVAVVVADNLIVYEVQSIWIQFRATALPEKAQVFCVHASSAHGPSLTILCEGGHIFRVNLSTMDKHEVSMITVAYDAEASIVALDDSQLAISGVYGQGGKGIGIWNCQLNCLQNVATLPDNAPICSQMFCHDNQLLLICGGNLFCFPFSKRSATLRANLGKLKAAKPSFTTEAQLKLQEIVDQLSDPAKPPTQKTLDQAFKEVKSILQESGKSCTEGVLLQPLVSSLITICLDCSFWPRSQLDTLIQSKLIPSGCSVRLMKALSDHAEVEMALDALDRIRDLPEAGVVAAVSCILSADDNKLPQMKDSKEQLQPEQPLSDFSPKKKSFVFHCMNRPFSDIFMVESLRSMKVEHVQELMKLLSDELVCLSQHLLSLRALTTTQIVDWISMLVDAHFTQLVLSREFHPLFLVLHNIVKEQMEFYNELSCLEEILQRLRDQVPVPAQKNIGAYCIQTLHIL